MWIDSLFDPQVAVRGTAVCGTYVLGIEVSSLVVDMI